MSKQLTAKAEAGKKGGMKRVPKGFARKSDAEKTKAAMKGNWSRWGRKVKVELEFVYLPSRAEKIMKAAEEIAAGFVPPQKVEDINDAISILVSESVMGLEDGLELNVLGCAVHDGTLTDFDKARLKFMDRDESEEKAQAEAPITEVVQ